MPEFKFDITGDASGIIAASGQASSALKQTAQATEKGGDAQGQAGKKSEEHKKHIEGLSKACNFLNQILPGVGSLLQSVFSPIGALIGFGVIALEKFMEAVKETRDELKRMEEEAAKPLGHQLEAMRDGVVKNATSLAELKDKLQQAALAEQTLKDKTQTAIQAQREQFEAARSVGEAQMQLEMARLEGQHEQGLVSDAQYYEAKLKLEADYRAAKRKAEEDEEQAEIEIQKRAIKTAKDNRKALIAAAAAATSAATTAETNLAGMENPKEAKSRADDAKKALKEWLEKTGFTDEVIGHFQTIRDSNVDAKAGLRKAGYDAADTSELAQAYGKWLGLTTNAESMGRMSAAAPGNYARAKVAAESTGRAAARADRAAEENESFIGRGEQDLSVRQAHLDARKALDAKLGNIELMTALTQTLTRIGDVNKALHDQVIRNTEAGVATQAATIQHMRDLENEQIRIRSQLPGLRHP